MVNGRTSGAHAAACPRLPGRDAGGAVGSRGPGRFVDDRDEAAFEVLLGRHGPMVLNVCRQILRDPDDAEDAFQATFLALACKASTLRVGESLGPWLYRVANRVAARARANRRRRAIASDPEARSRSRPSLTIRIAIDLPSRRARGARSPARAAPGADRPVLPGRDDPRAGRATAPLPGGDGAQPDGPRPRPAPRADRPSAGSSLHPVARRRAGVERVRIGRHAAYPEFPGQGRDAARRRHRLAPGRVRSLGARRRSTGRSPERVESQAARRLDGGSGRRRGRRPSPACPCSPHRGRPATMASLDRSPKRRATRASESEKPSAADVSSRRTMSAT